MAGSNIARQHGDCFQGRIFWLHAALLLDPDSPVERVLFEVGPRGFDDLVVEYDPQRAPLDHEGQPLHREHIQCKWHASPGSFGFADFVEPAFINATTYSLLQNARRAQLDHAPGGTGSRFKLLTNWRIANGDPLEYLVSKSSDAFNLQRLQEGKTSRSRMGAVRKLWCDHLGIDEPELLVFARTLAVAETVESLDSLRSRLDERFAAAGLRRIPPSSSAFLYDDLVQKLHAQGRIDFDRQSFRAMSAAEDLLRKAEPDYAVPTFGVRSFMHPIDNLDDRCDKMLNLVPYFDGRYIRDPADWHLSILPELNGFLRGHAQSSDAMRLILDTHVSLAFATGALLNMKSGKRIEIEQRGHGRALWSRDDHPVDASWPELAFDDEDLSNAGDEIAVALSLTHDVSAAVQSHVAANLPSVGSIVYCRPGNGISQSSVRCGHHAWRMAESLVANLAAIRAREKGGRVHLFMAGPNALAVLLGQHQQAIGPVTLYEWDFERQRGGGYSPAVQLG